MKPYPEIKAGTSALYAELVEHYRRRGLTGSALYTAIMRHTKLLAPLDGEQAKRARRSVAACWPWKPRPTPTEETRRP